MSYWRLHISRSYGIEEEYDLREKSSVIVGDDSSNDVSIQTTTVPSRLPVVSMRFGKPRVRLSQEVSPSLKGQVQRRKSWKTKLYQGQEYDVQSKAEWKIGDAHFRLELAEEQILSPYENPVDAQARKHWLQSLGVSAGSHLGLLLILVVLGLLLDFMRPEEAELEVQKISVAQVKDLFEPEPEPEPEPQDVKEKVEQKKAQRNLAQKKVSRPAAKVSKAKSAPAKVAKGKGAKKRDVKKMGLLALQSSSSRSASSSLRVRKPQGVVKQVQVADRGASFGGSGEGIRSGRQTNEVARLDGIEGGSYQAGELGSQVGQVAKGPAIQLVKKEVEIRGGLDPAVIQQIIEERLPEVRYCYETALLKEVNLSGKISTSWTIASDGSVTNLRASSGDIQEKALQDCMRKRMLRWKFPSPKGGGVVHVKYPFVFSSLGG